MLDCFLTTLPGPESRFERPRMLEMDRRPSSSSLYQIAATSRQKLQDREFFADGHCWVPACPATSPPAAACGAAKTTTYCVVIRGPAPQRRILANAISTYVVRFNKLRQSISPIREIGLPANLNYSDIQRLRLSDLLCAGAPK